MADHLDQLPGIEPDAVAFGASVKNDIGIVSPAQVQPPMPAIQHTKTPIRIGRSFIGDIPALDKRRRNNADG